MKLIVIVFSAIITVTTALQEADIVSARIEVRHFFSAVRRWCYQFYFIHSFIGLLCAQSCRGCSLNRLPEVKKFILDDAPKYERLQVNFITGAPPELILLGEDDAELERLSLSSLTRDQCNELLISRGFKQTANKLDL